MGGWAGIPAIAAHPWAYAALEMVHIVGIALAIFAANPAELLSNRAFVAKLGLVMLAGINAALFHARGGLALADGVARAQTLLSTRLWIARRC